MSITDSVTFEWQCVVIIPQLWETIFKTDGHVMITNFTVVDICRSNYERHNIHARLVETEEVYN